MHNRNLLRGLFLIAISLAFGLQSLRYPIGGFGRAGPGMFPLLVSSLLFLLGVATVVRSFLVERVPLDFNIKNIAVILASLCGFVLVSKYVNMIAGIVFMVFCASLAGSASYSVVRNLKIAGGLIAIAFVFQKLLGLQLPLY
jgi:NADH:ubiquinone oxidoreductase subunit K